jgi:hypothetical protein
MKTRAIILSLLLIPFLIQSQSVWAPSGATWHYSYENFADRGYVKISYVQDSTVAGKQCKVLEKIRYRYSNISSTYDTATIGLAFTYLENDTVYHYHDNQFYILYDFSAQSSDSWQADTITTAEVDSTGSMQINSTNFNWLSVSSAGGNTFYGKIVERIGCIENYMFPEHPADGHEGGTFRCYEDDSISYDITSSGCDYIVSMESVESEQSEISVYPNPAENEINIELKTSEGMSYEIEIYSSFGQRMRTIKTAEQNNSIDIRDLSPGIYFVILKDGKKRQYVKKIIKS